MYAMVETEYLLIELLLKVHTIPHANLVAPVLELGRLGCVFSSHQYY